MILTRSKKSVLIDKTTQALVSAQGDKLARPAKNAPIYSTFKITDTKLYLPIVTLSPQDDNNLLEQLKTGFKRIIKWNKCTLVMFNQTKNNNSNYLIDSTLSKVNRLFVL